MKKFTYNNILLIVLCALAIILGGTLTAKKNAALNAQRRNLKLLEQRRESLSLALSQLNKTADEKASAEPTPTKAVFPLEESPDMTYAYFDELTRYLSLDLNYRFRTEKDVRYEQINENHYKLVGKGSFADVYRFICAIEQGAMYYRFHRLRLEETEDFFHQKDLTNALNAKVNFTLELSGYSYQHGVPEESLPPVQMRWTTPAYALFSPPRILISEWRQWTAIKDDSEKPVRENLPRLLPDASLVAISGDIAYVRDASGKIVSLHRGDQVFEGEVTSVDLEKGMMEITPIEEGDKLVFRVTEVGMWGTRQ